MSAAELLAEVLAAGIELRVEGDDLALQAPAEPPPDLRLRLVWHKPEILALLRDGEGGWAAAPQNGGFSWWKLHYADGTEKEIGRLPDATRAEILERYPDAVAAKPFVPVIRRPEAPLSAVEELAIRQWLAQIGETDPLTIAEAIDRCRREADSRETFLRVAYAALPPPDLSDDRRLCLQCRNLTGTRCLAWRQIGAGPRYEPFLDQKLRCVAYAPDSTDPDQRGGLERWPGLLKKWED